MNIRTIKELAQEAIDCQDYSNLSGCVHSFSRVITELREHLSKDGNFSTEELHSHPICVLFSNKISSLTYSEEPGKFSDSYTWAKEKANV